MPLYVYFLLAIDLLGAGNPRTLSRDIRFAGLITPFANFNYQDGQYLRPSDPSYEQVLDSLAMVARHTPLPLLEALLRWRERYFFLMLIMSFQLDCLFFPQIFYYTFLLKCCS
jgi:hypothetical protein